jgi:hypothetical protein
MESHLLGFLQGSYLLSLAGAFGRFEWCARSPARAQATRLRTLLASNRRCAYGRACNFAAIDSVRAYQDRVPITDYDGFAPWIRRVADGEPRVLTEDPVIMAELTCGSTAGNKTIPYTRRLLDEFAAATHAWIFNLYTRNLGLLGTRSYWSVSPVVRERSTTPGGLPVGFEDDTEYFGWLSRWALRQMLAVSPAVARLPSFEQWRRETLVQLVAADDLGLISIWSPTFLTVLLETLMKDRGAILAAIPRARRQVVERAMTARPDGSLAGEILWPRLQLISCWTDGSAAACLPALRQIFPTTPIQGKGLLATEGVVSVPIGDGDGAVLAVGSHVLEFTDLDHPAARPRLAHELSAGGAYSPLLTTGGGLYRYPLRDVVRCVGFYRATPRVRFEGRLDQVSDLCGEKLDARLVDLALLRVRAQADLTAEFCLLAPVQDPRTGTAHYCLFIESNAEEPALERFARLLEQILAAEGCHYGYCRKLGQLGSLQVQRVRNGWATFQRTLLAQGQRVGSIKPASLDQRPIWAAAFSEPPSGSTLR